MARILIAVDGSPPSQRALEFGASLAAKLGVGILLLNITPQVAPPMGSGPGALTELQHTLQSEGTHLLESLAGQVRPLGVAVETELDEGDPAISIYDRAEQPDIQMVVMGSRGHGAMARLLLGSVATKVVHTSSKPVVVVR